MKTNDIYGGAPAPARRPSHWGRICTCKDTDHSQWAKALQNAACSVCDVPVFDSIWLQRKQRSTRLTTQREPSSCLTQSWSGALSCLAYDRVAQRAGRRHLIVPSQQSGARGETAQVKQRRHFAASGNRGRRAAPSVRRHRGSQRERVAGVLGIGPLVGTPPRLELCSST